MSWEFKCAKSLWLYIYIWWRVFISKIGPAYDFRFIYISSLLRLFFFNRERIVLLANQVAHKLVWCRAINSTSHIEIEEEVDVLYICNGCHLLSLTFMCVDKHNKNITSGDKNTTTHVILVCTEVNHLV
jgi:hypothetical protein